MYLKDIKNFMRLKKARYNTQKRKDLTEHAASKKSDRQIVISEKVGGKYKKIMYNGL